MSLIHWRNFSRKPEIKNLPLQQQKKLFEEANRKATENNWFLEYQLVAGASGAAFSGIGVDGPIAGATVISSVGTTTTNANGEFTFASTPTGPITLLGGKDSITGVDFEGELVGFPQYKTISPITTFAHYLQLADAEESGSPMTIDEAVTKTFASSSFYFGVELPIEEKDVVLQKDFVREAIENNNKVGISAQAVTTQIEAITETVGASLVGSQTQQDFTKKYGSAGAIPQFTVQNRKRTAYAALGRSTRSQGTINIEDVVKKVKFVDPIDGRNLSRPVFGNLSRLTTQLGETVRETTTLAGSEQFTNNYLTTRIQALNRAQKTTIKNEAATAVAGGSDFSKIQSISTSSAIFNGLSRIETDRANETTPQLDKVTTWTSTGTFTQQRIGKFGDIPQQTVTLKSLDKQYFFAGDVKDNPMLLKSPKINTFATADFDAASSQNQSPETDQQIFPKTPLTHTLQDTNDTTGAVTTQTTVFRPFITEFEEAEFGPVASKVGLRLSSLTTAVVQPKNTVDHLTTTAGTYAGSYKGVGASRPSTVFSMTAETISKEDARIRLNITLTKGSLPTFTLVPSKETGIFELNQRDTAAVATNLRFVSDRLLINFKDAKGESQELFIKFTKAVHIASTGTYSISKPSSIRTIMNNELILDGAVRRLRVSYDKIGVEIIATDTKLAPNGPFTLNVDGKSIGTNFNFTNNTLNFIHNATGYTVSYQAPL
tara:strand:+ start:14 stop:2161 length:2148 start_codon:yes stop_codon:yes gene_type:complete